MNSGYQPHSWQSSEWAWSQPAIRYLLSKMSASELDDLKVDEARDLEWGAGRFTQTVNGVEMDIVSRIPQWRDNYRELQK